MSRDIRTKSVLISPRGNCPVLFGIRALTYDSALGSCKHLMASKRTEKVENYLVFKTNQATDDHLGENSTAVVKEVTIKRRGSTKIRCKNGDDLMAFAESGEVKLLAQWLLPGDEIEYNGLRNEHGTIHLEKLKVISAEVEKRRPKCFSCDVTLKSMGKINSFAVQNVASSSMNHGISLLERRHFLTGFSHLAMLEDILPNH